MITEVYTQLLGGILIPYPLNTVGESPVVFGVTIAILGLTLVILRRRSAHHSNADFSYEESLFPSPPKSANENMLEALNQSDQPQVVTRSFAPLKLVSKEFSAEPHAFLRKLIATEALALQELVSQANSLQLIVDTSNVQQSPICLEILRLAQQILKCASQRNATAELLLDDAEEQSVFAAKELLEQPLQMETTLDSGRILKIDPNSNWVDTTRSLLNDVEQDLRIVAVG